MERLSDSGLVTIVREKNVQVFQPNSPEALRLRVEQVQKTANEVIPELQNMLRRRQPMVEVRTLVGREGFLANLYEMLSLAEKSESREICIIGGAGAHESNPFELCGDEYGPYVATSAAKKVKKRFICTPRYADLYKREFAIHPNNQLRMLHEGLSSPSLTRIIDDMIAIEVYQPEVLILQIRHKEMANGYKETFNALWKKAKAV